MMHLLDFQIQIGSLSKILRRFQCIIQQIGENRRNINIPQIQLTGVLLLGILLFHRKIGSLLLDLFVNILLILSIEVGIFLGNYLLAQGAFENLVWYGNVTMLFKMFFMIPVTAAAVMWRKRQQETEMGNLQILLLLLLPLFSVLFLYSLIEMGRIYMDLYTDPQIPGQPCQKCRTVNTCAKRSKSKKIPDFFPVDRLCIGAHKQILTEKSEFGIKRQRSFM